MLLTLIVVLNCIELTLAAPGGCYSRCRGPNTDTRHANIPTGAHQIPAPIHEPAYRERNFIPEDQRPLFYVLPTVDENPTPLSPNSAAHAPHQHQWPDYLIPANVRDRRGMMQEGITDDFNFQGWALRRLDSPLTEGERTASIRINNVGVVGQIVFTHSHAEPNGFRVSFRIDRAILQSMYQARMGRFLDRFEIVASVWVAGFPTRHGASTSRGQNGHETLLLARGVRRHDENAEQLSTITWGHSFIAENGIDLPRDFSEYDSRMFGRLFVIWVAYFEDMALISSPPPHSNPA